MRYIATTPRPPAGPAARCAPIARPGAMVQEPSRHKGFMATQALAKMPTPADCLPQSVTSAGEMTARHPHDRAHCCASLTSVSRKRSSCAITTKAWEVASRRFREFQQPPCPWNSLHTPSARKMLHPHRLRAKTRQGQDQNARGTERDTGGSFLAVCCTGKPLTACTVTPVAIVVLRGREWQSCTPRAA